ncbi:DNA polymerase III subunit delta' [Bifidobacterium sp. W8101]|uniref:DNA polymerase III subunit delta' n=1 Tax=Bifidobacterium TaxID=1678 RepID=UPI0018DB52BA|nr:MULTISPECIES: DNA polymerase III subunit delta' [Bifidobacterium]MBI0126358.1 DNA polymerase III subunit delta' [Bifidobacterium choladohabitans]MBI0127927.1 DNA polymerase III subunit delta' [Bifidobacterium sp. W8103]MBI0138515.1 DNA polymerase III subunit delta' [Bifidobacterium sp. W8105]MBI0148515.1 DNA polymerase III subunit delta' [Bifidobacterium sp. W8107]
MSVWDAIVGQQLTVELLKRTVAAQAQGHDEVAQSWLICGPPGSGRSNLARAFAAALISPDQGLSDQPTRVTQQVLAGTHPDVTILSTNKVTIGINEVRELIMTSEQMPSTSPWRVIIIEDVDRMLERTTNVLLKEIEEPAEHTIWLLCAPSAQDVLPTIRSRTRVLNLAVPSNTAVADFLTDQVGVDRPLAAKAARLAQGHIGIARLYATRDQVLADRDELVVGLLGLRRASDAVILAGRVVDAARDQATATVDDEVARDEREFRQINGLRDKERIPRQLRGAYHALGGKDQVRRRVTRLTRDVLDRNLSTLASVYRDVGVLQNGAEEKAGLVNLENRAAIADLSVRLSRQGAIERIQLIARARRRLAANGSPLLVFEALFCTLLV